MSRHLTPQDFRDLGLLAEVNRRVLHPIGLAMAVTTDDTGAVTSLGPIYDYRDDPEGVYFVVDDDLRAKVAFVREVERARRPAREAALGYFVQAVDLPGRPGG